MKLATKYQVKSIREAIINTMKESWPIEFAQWEEQRHHEQALRKRYRDSQWDNDDEGRIDGKYLDDCLPEPAAAIRFAHDYGVLDILPAAYFALSLIPAENDWDKIRRDEPSKLANPDIRTARWSLLHPEEIQRVLVGREMLMASVALIYESCQTDNLEAVLEGCTASCSQKFPNLVDYWQKKIFRHVLWDSRRPNPIELQYKILATRSDWGLCGRCGDVLYDHNGYQQECIWLSLPKTFDVQQMPFYIVSHLLTSTFQKLTISLDRTIQA